MKIDSYPKLLAMLLLQKANLPTYQTEVGATAAGITAVEDYLSLCHTPIESFSVASSGLRRLCYTAKHKE